MIVGVFGWGSAFMVGVLAPWVRGRARGASSRDWFERSRLAEFGRPRSRMRRVNPGDSGRAWLPTRPVQIRRQSASSMHGHRRPTANMAVPNLGTPRDRAAPETLGFVGAYSETKCCEKNRRVDLLVRRPGQRRTTAQISHS